MKKHITLWNEDDGDAPGYGGGGGATEAVAVSTAADGGAGQDSRQGGEGFDFRAALDERGNFRAGWDQGLPADLRDQAAGALAKYQSPLELVRGLANAQRLIGQRPQVRPPGADARPEEVSAWRRSLGVPETPEGYGIQRPESLPDGVEWSDEAVVQFSGLAHELNLTPAQVQKLVDYDAGRQAQAAQTAQARLGDYLARGRAELEQEWGERLQTNVGRAVQTAQALGLDPNDPEISNSPKILKALFAASRLMQEDRLSAAGRSGAGMTGAQQAEDIRLNPNNPWHAAYMGREGKDRQSQAQAWMDGLRRQ
ncbi:hypothetical protein WJU23_14505 [Prosthecobacter sp. SYSU 5D2]|uniref:hypothetical protein n=1 Tax=Prosthecobacter sp. SYSU 5D2 TaxID=3134134 RepID=UPI0031FE6C03